MIRTSPTQRGGKMLETSKNLERDGTVAGVFRVKRYATFTNSSGLEEWGVNTIPRKEIVVTETSVR